MTYSPQICTFYGSVPVCVLLKTAYSRGVNEEPSKKVIIGGYSLQFWLFFGGVGSSNSEVIQSKPAHDIYLSNT